MIMIEWKSTRLDSQGNRPWCDIESWFRKKLRGGTISSSPQSLRFHSRYSPTDGSGKLRFLKHLDDGFFVPNLVNHFNRDEVLVAPILEQNICRMCAFFGSFLRPLTDR